MILLIGLLFLGFGCVTSSEKDEVKAKIPGKDDYLQLLDKKVETFKGNISITTKELYQRDYEIDYSKQYAEAWEKWVEKMPAEFDSFVVKKGDMYKAKPMGSVTVITISNHTAYWCTGTTCNKQNLTKEEEKKLKEQTNLFVETTGSTTGPFPRRYDFLDEDGILTVNKLGEKEYYGKKCTEFEIEIDKESIPDEIKNQNASEYVEVVQIIKFIDGPIIDCVDEETGISLHTSMILDRSDYLKDMGNPINIARTNITKEVIYFSTSVSDSEFELPEGYKIKEAGEK